MSTQSEPGDSLPRHAAPVAERLRGALVMRDGARVRTRPIMPEDTERLRAFHMHLSRASVTFRFFHYMPELSIPDAERFTHIDYHNRMALVATQGEGADERILAVVRYERMDETSAEVAFVVADEWQGHGLATALLLQLADYARALGVTRFVAIVMPSNMRMFDVLRHCGYPIKSHFQAGEDVTTMDLSATPAPPFAPLTFIPDVAE